MAKREEDDGHEDKHNVIFSVCWVNMICRSDNDCILLILRVEKMNFIFRDVNHLLLSFFALFKDLFEQIIQLFLLNWSIVVSIGCPDESVQLLVSYCPSLVLKYLVHKVPELSMVQTTIAIQIIFSVDFIDPATDIFVSKVLIITSFLLLGWLLAFSGFFFGGAATHFIELYSMVQNSLNLKDRYATSIFLS